MSAGFLWAADTMQHILHPAGVQAERIADLWDVTLAICTLVFFAVVGACLLALRRGATRDESPPRLPQTERKLFRSVAIAVAVSIALLFAIIAMDFFTARALAHIDDENALRIEITGHQWWWEARYLDDDPSQSFVTANELHIPIGRTVVAVLQSADVIHSLWIPSLHGKRDLLPGQTATLRFRADRAGTYRAEFCDFQHARMTFAVIAQTAEEFTAWQEVQLQPAPPPASQTAARGKELFETGTCASCHAIQGTTANAVFGPDLTHVASRPTLGAGTIDNAREFLRAWISDPQQFKPGVNMPAQPLPPDDLDALVTYLETLK